MERRTGPGTDPAPAPTPRPAAQRALTTKGSVTARARALVQLLGDDSPRVFAASIAEAERGGEMRRLLRSALSDDDARRRVRARAVLRELDRRDVIRRLLRLAAKGVQNLESALFVLARLEHPRFDARPYRKALDAIAVAVEKRLVGEDDPLRRSMVLVDHLANGMRFVGAEADYHHPQHVHLHRAIERRQGLPLTLAAIYLFVARRVGIGAGVLPLPGHVFLRLDAGSKGLIVDPFHRGAVRTRGFLVRYLAEHELTPRPEWFRDADDAQLFQRHTLNLMHSEQLGGRLASAEDLFRVAEIVPAGRRELLRETITES